MADRKKMDEINRENGAEEQFLEDAKAKLRWYTSEATEDEFDEDAVVGLVNIIAALDKTYSGEEQDEEQLKEQFNAYCNLYRREEERRRSLKSYKGMKTFGKKGIAIAVAAACILLLIITGSTRDMVNAGEDGGFFNWLKKDKEGILAVTSPEKVGLSAEEKYPNMYDSIETIPEEYQQYLVRKEEISLLQEYELKNVECVDMGSTQSIKEIFISDKEYGEIQLGILIYEDETMIVRDKFVNYEFLYTNMIGERELDVYKKVEENGDITYLVSFYQGNKKYFVSGKEDIEFLEAITEEYMDLIF